MRLADIKTIGQAIFFAYCTVLFSGACSGKKEDIPVIPPVTSPLSGNYIGFGVLTASYTHVIEKPEEGSASIGYLRRGDLVRIIKRQIVSTKGAASSWVLIYEPSAGGSRALQGWLRENEMDIYDNESRAKTAARIMNL
jgi:hypothetical protein